MMCFQAILHSEGHMDDGLTLSRSQREESHTARLIRSAVLLFTRFVRYRMLDLDLQSFVNNLATVYYSCSAGLMLNVTLHVRLSVGLQH